MLNRAQSKLVCFFVLFVCHAAFAAFDVVDDEEYFGNGQTRPFKNAIEGTETVAPEELAYLNAVDVTRVINRWYIKGFFGNPRMKFNEIGNNASGSFSGMQPGTSEYTKYLYNVTLAAGKVWNQWALELELYFMKELEFDIAPAYYSTPLNAHVKMNQAAAFINAQYILPRYFSWYPKRLQIHFDAGLGASLRQTDLSVSLVTTGAQVGSSSNRTIYPSSNLGVGFRYQLTANVLFDVVYRYFFFGKTEIGPTLVSNPDPAFIALYTDPFVGYESSKFQANGFFIGAAYQF